MTVFCECKICYQPLLYRICLRIVERQIHLDIGSVFSVKLLL
jgi:hypothetical protein